VSCQGLFTPGNTLFELQKTDTAASNHVSCTTLKTFQQSVSLQSSFASTL
jgi:hypothetical protein